MHYIYILTPLYSQYALIHVSTLKGAMVRDTNKFCEHGQQNTCPDVNIILKRGMLYYVAIK